MVPRTLFLASLFLLVSLAGCADDADDTTSPMGGQQVRPPYERGQIDGGLFEMDMYVHDEECTFSPHEGKELDCFTFSLTPETGGTIPGPEIRVTQGDTVRVTFHSDNALVFHTMHWHGISVPNEMDGVPFMTQPVGTLGEEWTYVYEFEAYEPGTYWYHCHVEAPSHVDAGMFGAIIVDPADPTADPAYDNEAILFLHEADSAGLAAFGDPPTLDDIPDNPVDAAIWGAGFARGAGELASFLIGEGPVPTGMYPTGVEEPRSYYPAASARYRPVYDTFMINGKSYPETEPVITEEGDVTRIRMINAGQNVHTMHLHGHHFLVTHRDGYPLPAPFWADSLPIGPGGRYDVYVYADNPGIWDFHDHGGGSWMGGYASNDFAFPGGMATVFAYEGYEPAVPAHRATAGDFVRFA